MSNKKRWVYQHELNIAILVSGLLTSLAILSGMNWTLSVVSVLSWVITIVFYLVLTERGQISIEIQDGKVAKDTVEGTEKE